MAKGWWKLAGVHGAEPLGAVQAAPCPGHIPWMAVLLHDRMVHLSAEGGTQGGAQGTVGPWWPPEQGATGDPP